MDKIEQSNILSILCLENVVEENYDLLIKVIKQKRPNERELKSCLLYQFKGKRTPESLKRALVLYGFFLTLNTPKESEKQRNYLLRIKERLVDFSKKLIPSRIKRWNMFKMLNLKSNDPLMYLISEEIEPRINGKDYTPSNNRRPIPGGRRGRDSGVRVAPILARYKIKSGEKPRYMEE